jgi:dextranase
MMELSTCKGLYSPDDPITLSLDCGGVIADMAEICITRLEKTVGRYWVPVNRECIKIELSAMGEDGACYGVEAWLFLERNKVGSASTAVNVGGDVVRYGFLSDFQPEDDTDITCMAKYHIDHVQFYDWSYRHDTLVSPTQEFSDMMGKENSLPVIRQKIAACHDRSMLAMAYGAVYAASREFWETHRSWGLYNADFQPMRFISVFYYMDIESPWREHLFGQYLDAIRRVGFDGIHMDTYGEPKRALSSQGETRELDTALPKLVGDADTFLRKAGVKPHLIFNNVGGWSVQLIRQEPQDAVYMELWPPMDRLRHIQQAVSLAQPSEKPIVLAAYPAAFRTESPERALYGEMILSFAIALCGATQLFLGEQDAVVTQGYYAHHVRLNSWQTEKIKAYQDFFVRYQELLFDRRMRDVSLTHSGGDNKEYTCDMPFSVEAEPGKLWLTFRECGAKKLIGLINLVNETDDHWNQGKGKPDMQENIVLHVLMLHPVENAWYATPDEQHGAAQKLNCSCMQTDIGIDVAICIPKLNCCGLLWL